MFATKYSYNYLNKDRITTIKERLVSRSEEDIISAVEDIFKLTENDDTIESVLYSDVPVLLSEAVAPGYCRSNM